MSDIRTEFGFERTECSCEECTRYCFHLPGALIPADLDAISSRLGYDDPIRFAVENLLASPGAILSNGVNQIRIPTLVPQRGPDGACKFLRDRKCSIHAQAPYCCSFFDAHQSESEANDRSLRGHLAIVQEWAQNGVYARLWRLLDSMGLRAPSPVEARERMRRDAESRERTSTISR